MRDGSKSHVDKRWFDRYKKLSTLPGLTSLRGDNRKKEKHLFLKGKVENPQFSYGSLDSFEVDVRKKELEELKREVERQEENEVVKEAYKEKIDHKIDDCTIIESVQQKNDALYDQVMQKRYGNVSVDLACAVINAYIEALRGIVGTSEGKKQSAAKELHHYLLDVQSRIGTTAVYAFGLINISEKKERILSAREIKKLFESKRDGYGLLEWKVEIDIWGRSNSISVRHKDKKVVIPRGRRLGYSQACALAEHEFGVHIRRRENGERTKLALLGVGLSDFLRGEEGLAKYHESQSYEGAINSSLKSYLLVALTLGVDGRPRSFREIYKVCELIYVSMKDTYFFTEVRSEKHYAWGKTARLFRGTTGKSNGICSRRPLVYLDGYVRIKDIIEKKILSESEMMLGKYDPSNEKHVHSLKKLSILQS